MNRPEGERGPHEDLCANVEALLSADIERNSLLKIFIAPAEISKAAKGITEFTRLLIANYPTERTWTLPLFFDLIRLDFCAPDEDGVISFLARSHAEQCDAEDFFGPFVNKEPVKDELLAAESIIAVALVCLTSQLEIVYKRIRAGCDDGFDHALIKDLGGRESWNSYEVW